MIYKKFSRLSRLTSPDAKRKAPALRCVGFIGCVYFRTVSVFCLLALLFFIVPPASAAPFNEPWDLNSPEKTPQGQEKHGFNPLRSFVEFYRVYISPIDGKDCPMYPSCSEYSIQSFKKHGLFIGWAMTCDRLYRCGRDELRLSPEIIVNGEFRCYDPVEANDFWWYDGK
jgi:uncharacterized protein